MRQDKKKRIREYLTSAANPATFEVFPRRLKNDTMLRLDRVPGSLRLTLVPDYMKIKVTSNGRWGHFELEKGIFYIGIGGFRIEPWSGLHYVFHGLCLPIIFERIVDEYRSHRVRAPLWNLEGVNLIWKETGDLWLPVIDWVNEKQFERCIGFRYHPRRIEWYWNQGLGDSKNKTEERLEGLRERFEILGKRLRERNGKRI